MANRAYLYGMEGKQVTGISEYNYDVPIAYKILLSQNTKMVKSRIFTNPFKIALQGNFEKGVERLYSFLEELKTKGYFEENELEEAIADTKAFLRENSNCEYFYLDCGEIYDMSATPLYLSNVKMFQKIKNVDKEIKLFYKEMDEMKKEYEVKKQGQIKEDMMNKIGIREWSEYLFYEIEEK